MSATVLLFGIILPWLVVGLFVALSAWISFQLIHQNGCLLARLESLEQRLGQMSVGPAMMPAPEPLPPPAPLPAPPPMPAGFSPGSEAPPFELPDLNGERRSLAGLRGKELLLIFSDPKSGPCMALAPKLGQECRRSGDVQVLMVSRGNAEANHEKVQEHGLTFPVVLQRRWEISRRYAMVATSAGYLIDKVPVITADVATGGDAILAMMSSAEASVGKRSKRHCACGRPVGQCECGQQKAKTTNGRWNGR